MVVDEPSSSETVTSLPHLALHSMTQSQLKDLIPQLVTRVTGRTSPLFGSSVDKPDWWPCDLEWTSPEELADKYQDPCEKLREIVRSCYCYMDQDNLLNSSDLAEFSSELPVSPAIGDTDVCATHPDTEPSSDKQVDQVDVSVTKELDEKLDEPDSGMTVQSKTSPREDIENASESVEKWKKLVEETTLPSKGSKLDCNDKAEHSRNDIEVEDGATAVVNDRDTSKDCEIKMEDDATAVVDESDTSKDCEITGTSVSKAQDISADVIAQIDFEIAKSLKAAFLSSVGNLGLTNADEVNDGSRDTNGPLNFGSLFGLDTNLRPMKKVSRRRRSAEEVKQKTDTYRPFPGISKTLQRKPTAKQQTSISKDKPLSEYTRIVQTLKPVNDKLVTKTATGCIKAELPDIVKEESKEEKQEDDVVWICFVCAKGFPDQSELMKHQDMCEDELGDTDSAPPLKSSHPVSGSSKGHSTIPTTPPGKNQSSHCQPVPTLLRKVGSSLKSLPLGLPNKSTLVRKRRRKFEDIYIPPSRDVYFESLGLFPTPRVEAISKSPRKSVTDDDCQIIDLTVEDPHAVPMTPRTRSMLSQLSRDDSSGRKHQLSFSQNMPPSVQDKEKMDFKELSEDSDSSEEEETVKKQKVPSKSAILGIPLTSPLGQRLKKHWNYENKVPIVEHIEMFCKTDARSLLSLNKNEKKNPMVEKLRNRPPPQCTFRFTKKYINRWSHSYKFNKWDKREFQKRLKFGLDRDSRVKLKRMKKCKVVLARISKKDIKYWTTPRPKVVQKRFSVQPTQFFQQYNRQYRLNQIQNAMTSSNSVRPMQGALYNQLIQPVRYGAPTPQLLVRTVPMGVQGMRLQVLPIQQQNQNLFLSAQNNLVAASPQEIARSQKRKQVFNNVREDDSMVICLSSDEEEEIVIRPLSKPKQQACAMCSINKNDCRIHGKRRIGPASFMRQQSNNADSTRDLKPNIPTNTIVRTTVNSVQPVHCTNTASARVFGTSNRPSALQTALSTQPKSNFTHLKFSDSIIAAVVSNPSGGEPVQQDASQTVQVKNETGSAEFEKDENQSADSDYMDYEVICIDSDEDEDVNVEK